MNRLSGAAIAALLGLASFAARADVYYYCYLIDGDVAYLSSIARSPKFDKPEERYIEHINRLTGHKDPKRWWVCVVNESQKLVKQQLAHEPETLKKPQIGAKKIVKVPWDGK